MKEHHPGLSAIRLNHKLTCGLTSTGGSTFRFEKDEERLQLRPRSKDGVAGVAAGDGSLAYRCSVSSRETGRRSLLQGSLLLIYQAREDQPFGKRRAPRYMCSDLPVRLRCDDDRQVESKKVTLLMRQRGG